jgi:hypothetical protein
MVPRGIQPVGPDAWGESPPHPSVEATSIGRRRLEAKVQGASSGARERNTDQPGAGTQSLCSVCPGLPRRGPLSRWPPVPQRLSPPGPAGRTGCHACSDHFRPVQLASATPRPAGLPACLRDRLGLGRGSLARREGLSAVPAGRNRGQLRIWTVLAVVRPAARRNLLRS